MNLANKHFKIAEMLAALFTGSQDEQDKRDLEQWVEEKERHRVFVKKVMDRERYAENIKALGKFNVEEAWDVVDKKITGARGRKVSFGKLAVRYAAAVVVLLTVSLYFWWDGDGAKEESPVMYRIAAGTTGARLTMGDGATVDIIKQRSVELLEADGTRIITDSAGIDYSARESADSKVIMNAVQTLTGMEYKLTLADGTKVYLNAETRLRFPTKFNGDQRVVELDGEAYFEVSPDAEHPFIVEAGSVKVSVLGTSFNVRSYDDENDIATTLVSGKVAVWNGTNRQEMVPGEQAVYERKTGEMEIRQVDVALYTAWHSGKFIFRNETLEEMMSYLSRWYGFQYRFIDEQAKQLQMGARLDRYDNMNPIVEMLRETGLVNITQVDNILYISSTQ